MTKSGQDELLEALRDGLQTVLAEKAGREDLRRFLSRQVVMDESLWEQGVSLGWFGLAVPEAHDGLGLGVSAAMILAEELGGALAPIPSLGALLATEALCRSGSTAPCARYLPAVVAGAMPGALALPGRAALPKLSDGLVLSGAVDLVMDGAAAKFAIIAARRADGALAFLVLDIAADGVVVETQPMADLTRSCARFSFPDLALGAAAVLNGDATALAASLAGYAALLVAADSLGAARAIFARTIDYMKTREQFGRPIGSFQALKHRAAEHHVAMVAAKALTSEAAGLWDANAASAPMHAALARAYACDVATKLATDAIQLHGGIGFTWEQDCHLYLRRVLLNEVLFGSNEAHLDRAMAMIAESFAAAA